MIKAMIFDLGGVLLENDFSEVIKELVRLLSINEDQLISLRKKYHKELLIGKMSIDSFNQVLNKQFNLKRINFFESWKKAYFKSMPKNRDLFCYVKKLKQTYKIALVSNIYDIYAKIDRERGLYSDFNPCILSCDVGFAKPQKEIYELALKKLNLLPEECLFIDDKEKNIIGSNKVGIKGILYKNLEQFKKELASFSIHVD